MAEKKFLDFIVPTKNRWHLLETTLLSFLAQTNKNFNLLIVDNSDEQRQELLAQKLLEKYKNTLSIKYYKTGGLNMLDNWNKGYQLSDADYCYLVTDKIVLDSRAVEIFEQGTKDYPDTNLFLFSISGDTHWHKEESKKLISLTLEDMANFFNACWGSELKAFLKRDFKNKLIQQYGKIIHFVGGDVDEVYLALMNSATYASINYNIIQQRNNMVGSVGRSGEYGGNIYKRYLQDHHLDYDNLYPYAPVNIANNWNGMYNDLFATAKLCNYPCDKNQINKVNYIIGLYISLIQFQRLYQVSNPNDFLKLHNYIEENNLQFHPEINNCFRYYANHYTIQDFRLPVKKERSHNKFSPLLEKIFSVKKENGKKIIRCLGLKLYIKR